MEHDELVLWAIRGIAQKCVDLTVIDPTVQVNCTKVREQAKRLQEHLTKLDDLVDGARARGVDDGQLPAALKRLARYPRAR